MKAKILDINNLLWLALALALQGSLRHLVAGDKAATLARPLQQRPA